MSIKTRLARRQQLCRSIILLLPVLLAAATLSLLPRSPRAQDRTQAQARLQPPLFPAAPMSARPIAPAAGRRGLSAQWSSQKRRKGEVMATYTLIRGGPPVEFLMPDGALAPNSPGDGNYGILPAGYSPVTAFSPTGAIPAANQSVTAGHFTVANTGRTQVSGGLTFPILTFQADSTATPGTGSVFEQGITNGSHAGAQFNIVGSAPKNLTVVTIIN